MRNKEKEIRDQALKYALRIAEEEGIEGLREEINRRGIMGLSLLAPAKEVAKIKYDITARVIDIIKIFAIYIMLTEFNFEKDEIQQFDNEFNELCAQALINTEKSFEEMRAYVYERTGLNITIAKGIGE